MKLTQITIAIAAILSTSIAYAQTTDGHTTKNAKPATVKQTNTASTSDYFSILHGLYGQVDGGWAHEMAKSKNGQFDGQDQSWTNKKFHGNRGFGDVRIGMKWNDNIRSDISVTKYANFSETVNNGVPVTPGPFEAPPETASSAIAKLAAASKGLAQDSRVAANAVADATKQKAAAGVRMENATNDLAKAKLAYGEAENKGDNAGMAVAATDGAVARAKRNAAIKDRVNADNALTNAIAARDRTDADSKATNALLDALRQRQANMPQAVQAAALSQSIHYKVKSEMVLANMYYDFDTGTAWSPYVTLGLGVAHNKLSANGQYDGATASGSVSKDAFAWQAGVGTSYAFTDHLYGDFGIRYTDKGHIKFDKDMAMITNGSADGTVHGHNKVDLTSIDTTIGIRYVF